MSKKLKIKSDCCASSVLVDAWATWDSYQDKMVLYDLFNHCVCEKCGNECKQVETEIEPNPAPCKLYTLDGIKDARAFKRFDDKYNIISDDNDCSYFITVTAEMFALKMRGDKVFYSC